MEVSGSGSEVPGHRSEASVPIEGSRRHQGNVARQALFPKTREGHWTSGPSSIRGYVASALTHVKDAKERERIDSTAELVSAELARHQIDCHLPSHYTSPHKEAGQRPPVEINDIDYNAVLESDLLILIADQPSFGAGKELVWAERNGNVIVVLTRVETVVSRLVSGSRCDVKELMYESDADLGRQLDSFIARKQKKLEAHAAYRAERAFELEPLRDGLSNGVTEIGVSELVTPDRAWEALSTPDQLDNSSFGEVRRLGRIAGVEIGVTGSAALKVAAGPLDEAEWAALDAARKLYGYDARTVCDLVGQVSELRWAGNSGKRRVGSFSDVESWESLRHG